MLDDTYVNPEIRNRIIVSVAAYAYEIAGTPFLTDQEYDDLAHSINPKETTGNKVMDKFFREIFSPHTGMWVHRHPNTARLAEIFEKYFKDKAISIRREGRRRDKR